jgi:hypothetical protein
VTVNLRKIPVKRRGKFPESPELRHIPRYTEFPRANTTAMVKKQKKLRDGRKYIFYQPIRRQHSYIRWNYSNSVFFDHQNCRYCIYSRYNLTQYDRFMKTTLISICNKSFTSLQVIKTFMFSH